MRKKESVHIKSLNHNHNHKLNLNHNHNHNLNYNLNLKLILSLFLILPVLIGSTPAIAQDNNTSLQEGARALQFSIGDNFRLGSFDGSVLSYQWQRSETGATRLGLSASVRLDRQSEPDNPLDPVQTLNDLRTAVRLSFLTYNRSESQVRFYAGHGPMLSLEYRRLKNESVVQEQKSSTTTVGVGYGMLFGTTWFPHEKISFFSEYRTDLTYQYRQVKNESGTQETRVRYNNVDLSGTGVRFGISVFF